MHPIELLGDVGHVESRSVCLEIVLVFVQDRCAVCPKHTIGSVSFWMHLMELLGDVGHMESCSVHLEMVLVLVHDRCTVCTKRTIGSYIVLDAPVGTPR